MSPEAWGQAGPDHRTEGGARGQNLTVRAVRVADPPEIDGVLDEPIWQQIEPITGFRQRWPVDGAPASERTEVRIAYDGRAIYFAMIMFDSEPERILANIHHRGGRLDKDDVILIGLDTYHDRKSAYIFEVNPLGTQDDAHFTNEALTFPDDWAWEGVYESEGRITDRGWELEVAIPLTTIRFEEGVSSMGVAFYRSIRRKNERVTWPHIPQRMRAGLQGGMDQASQYATLVGFEGLEPGRHVEVKPYGILGAQKLAGDEDATTLDEFGLDVKYSLTPGLTLDLTYHTDFAQVEVDNVQINLSRFGLFFPEKREFFLERPELFQFGNNRSTDIFFSRRIGINNDILAGGRIAGQAGPFTVGLLNLQTEDSDAGVAGANSTVLRLRGDVHTRATVGGIFTNHQNSDTYNRVLGVDGEYRFFGSSGIRGWIANSWDDLAPDDGTGAGFASLSLRSNLYQASATYTNVGENFNPALGFVRRRDMIRYGGRVAWTPRFPESRWARQFVLEMPASIIHGQDGGLQSEDVRLNPTMNFQSGDMAMMGLTHRFERLEAPFPIRPDVVIPAGDYDFNYMGLLVRLNDSREFSGGGVTHFGNYWNGTWLQYGLQGNWKTGPHLELNASIDRREISLPVENGEFDTTILGMSILGAISRKLFANALIQYDSDSEDIQANIRIDWIHTPGSDLFLVLDTGYFTGDLEDPRDERWVRRTGVVKLTYLKAF